MEVHLWAVQVIQGEAGSVSRRGSCLVILINV